MAVDGVGGLTVGGDRLDGIDGHPVDGGIKVALAVANGAADADERDQTQHAPGVKLPVADAKVFAGFKIREQLLTTRHGGGLRGHARFAVSTSTPRRKTNFIAT